MVRRVNQNIVQRFEEDTVLNEGLRSYMLKVYNYMALGLGLTGAVAFFVISNPSIFATVVGTPLFWVFLLAPLGIAMVLGASINRISFSTAQILFWVYAGCMGVSIASIAAMFTLESLARVFFITASTFGAMSLYGYTTKRDLSQMGSFLFMGLVGIVIASLVNLFFKSTGLHFILSIATVLVFTGLTAYDTQTIRSMYAERADSESQGKMAVLGALRLYLDFINIFISLLHLLGERK
ncbi:MAG: Bax inhibitor-1/YccA family protein [Alphaproteobacteria bacterium]